MTERSDTAEGLRRSVAVLMADGRWRTAQDVAARLGVGTQTAGHALARLVRMNLLVSETVKKDASFKLYRRAG